LETGTYRRVGSTELRHADIRVISATHRDLEQMVAQGGFREDLYYRLSTFPIYLPALRERQDDIVLLAAALLERVEPQRTLHISAGAMVLLQAQDFPGNVRELRNLLERTALLCDGNTIDVTHVEQALRSGLRPTSSPSRQPQIALMQSSNPVLSPAADAALKSLAHAALRQVVDAHKGSRLELAHKLGISERSLYRKLKNLDHGST